MQSSRFSKECPSCGFEPDYMINLVRYIFTVAKDHFLFGSLGNAARWDRVLSAMEDILIMTSDQAGLDHHSRYGVDHLHQYGSVNMAGPMPMADNGLSRIGKWQCQQSPFASPISYWRRANSSLDFGRSKGPVPSNQPRIARLKRGRVQQDDAYEARRMHETRNRDTAQSRQALASTVNWHLINNSGPGPFHDQGPQFHAYNRNGATYPNGFVMPLPPGFERVAPLTHAGIRPPSGFERVPSPKRQATHTPPGFERVVSPTRAGVRSSSGFESVVRPTPAGIRPPPGFGSAVVSKRPGIHPLPGFEGAVPSHDAQPRPFPGTNGASPSRTRIRTPPGLTLSNSRTEKQKGSHESNIAGKSSLSAEELKAHVAQNQRTVLVAPNYGDLIFMPSLGWNSILHEPKATSAQSSPSHADRLHDFCVAAEERSRQLAMDGEENRALWKTGMNGYASDMWLDIGGVTTRDEREKEQERARLIETLEANDAKLSESMERYSPLNHGGIHLRHPGMSDATESNGEAGHEGSDVLGHDHGSPGDEDLDLEGQEYEAEEYDGEDFPQNGEGDEDEEDLEDEGLILDAHPPGLKEISNLGKFTVSTHKQDNGVEELRSDDLGKFWQSDGTQPHNLTVYFIKKVAIREIRFYVDYDQDESYTPTRIIFRSGTSENNMLRFASMDLVSPKGWQKVPLEGVGGGADGNTLFCWVLQMAVMENHQNGKDTHLRGIRIFAVDVEEGAGRGAESERMDGMGEARDKGVVLGLGLGGEFLREPELR